MERQDCLNRLNRLVTILEHRIVHGECDNADLVNCYLETLKLIRE